MQVHIEAFFPGAGATPDLYPVEYRRPRLGAQGDGLQKPSRPLLHPVDLIPETGPARAPRQACRFTKRVRQMHLVFGTYPRPFRGAW